MKIRIFELKTTLEQGTEPDSVLETMLKNIESTLSEGLQQFPGDSHLLGAEADLANLLNESSRVQKSLEKAFETNPRNGFIAYRLARMQVERGGNEDAKKVFKKALDANRNDRRLHFGYAQLLVDEIGSSHDEIVYHLERSFAPGDSNFQARLLLGRQYYLANDFPKSKDVFKELSKMRASSEVRTRIYRPLETLFSGTVVKLEASYCFIQRVATSDWVFAYRDNIDETTWQSIVVNSEVRFRIGFTFSGVAAFDVLLAI
jgi:tetratricopeptide (TPR) repeat protein